jgi:hypothetical protein
MAVVIIDEVKRGKKRTEPVDIPSTLFYRIDFRSNTFAGIAPRGHSAMQKEVRIKMGKAQRPGYTRAAVTQ